MLHRTLASRPSVSASIVTKDRQNTANGTLFVITDRQETQLTFGTENSALATRVLSNRLGRSLLTTAISGTSAPWKVRPQTIACLDRFPVWVAWTQLVPRILSTPAWAQCTQLLTEITISAMTGRIRRPVPLRNRFTELSRVQLCLMRLHRLN